MQSHLVPQYVQIYLHIPEKGIGIRTVCINFENTKVTKYCF